MSLHAVIAAARRVSWINVFDGMNCREEVLRDHDQHGRVEAHKRNAAALADFVSVLQEHGVDDLDPDDVS